MLKNGKNTDSSYLLECFDQIIYFQALNFERIWFRLGEGYWKCIFCIEYSFRGKFPPTPEKRVKE